ncbi:MAG: hypothetical protein V1873_08315 [Verrucomicrobiota bacterium]
MTARWLSAGLWLVAVAGLAQTPPPAFPPPVVEKTGFDNGEWKEVGDHQLDLDAITPRGREILALPGISWKHAETPHFVIHYEQAIFARKVARMAEFFYSYIAQDLQGAQDRIKGRSHIFVFRSEKRWAEFRRAAMDVPEWTFSRVEGTVMFLQQAENTALSGNVLAHEMTHLVITRFFTRRVPLWLDEGLAEYYGEFAYAEFKGIKKSKRALFSRLADPYPLDSLFHATTYPAGSKEVQSFYETAKYMVGFLLLDHPSSQLLPFMDAVIGGQEISRAFSSHYGLSTISEIQKAFDKFAS